MPTIIIRTNTGHLPIHTDGPGGSTPAAPVGMTAVAVSASGINLSCTAVAGATLYRWQRSPAGAGTWTTLTTTGSPATLASGLDASTSYDFRVQYEDAGGTPSAWSAIATATTDAAETPPDAPATPTGLTAEAVSGSRINLTWDAVTGDTSYRVQKSLVSPVSWSDVGMSTVPAKAATGLIAETDYQFRVLASNAGGDSAYSTPATATTLTAGATTDIQAFTLHNYSTTAASLVRHRLGLPFVQGDVPAGLSILRADNSPVDFAIDVLNSYPDGSLRYANLLIIDDTPIPASGYRIYTAVSDPAAERRSTAAGYDPFAAIAAGSDVKVAITAMKAGPAPAGPYVDYSDRVYSHNRALARTARRKHHLDTDRVQVVESWEMARDETAGVDDGHLMGRSYIDLFRKADGTPAGMWVDTAIGQWWYSLDPFGSGEPAGMRTYQASLKNGATTLDTYHGGPSSLPIEHTYRSGWAAVRLADDDGHGLPHWVDLSGDNSEPMPTLWAEVDAEYWTRTGPISPVASIANPEDWPPFTDIAFASTGQTTNCGFYYPGRELGMRPWIDGPGGYRDRGYIDQFAAAWLYLQTATRRRHARTHSIAGMHIPNHVSIDHRPYLSGPHSGEPWADIHPYAFVRYSAPITYNTYPGLPVPVIPVMDGRLSAYSDPALNPNANSDSPGSIGGSYSNGTEWIVSGDTTHQPNPTYFEALYSGRRMLIDQTARAGYCAVLRTNSVYKGILYYGDAERGTPGTHWHGILGPLPHRAQGWGLWALAQPVVLLDEDDVRATIATDMLNHNIDYYHEAYSYFPENQKVGGYWWGFTGSAWMHGMMASAYYQIYRCTGSAAALELGHYTARGLVRSAAKNPLLVGSYLGFGGPYKYGPWHPTTNPYPDGPESPLYGSAVSFEAGNPNLFWHYGPGHVPNVGDRVWSTIANLAYYDGTPIPAPFSNGHEYEVASVDYPTLHFRLRPVGGGPDVIPEGNGSDFIFLFDATSSDLDDYWGYTTRVEFQNAGLWYSSDSLDLFGMAALLDAWRHGNPDLTPEIMANVDAYLAGWAPGLRPMEGQWVNTTNFRRLEPGE